MKDVAARAGANVASVSVVLNKAQGSARVSAATRERILQVAAELNYRPNRHAQRLGTNHRDRTVAIFSPNSPPGAVMFTLQHIQTLLNEKNIEVQVHANPYSNLMRHDEASLAADLRRLHPAAILVVGIELQEDTIQEILEYQNEGGVVVQISYGSSEQWQCDRLLYDDEHSAFIATQFLTQLGHKKIALALHTLPKYFEPSHPHLKGYKDALSEAGIEYKSDMVLCPGYLEEGGAELVKQYLNLPDKPTALCVSCEQVASAFVNVMHWDTNIRIPRDVSIITLNETMVGRFAAVPLSATTYPTRHVGDVGVALLCSRLDGSYAGSERFETIQSELVVRNSTATFLLD